MLLLRLFRMVHPMTLSRLFFPAAWAVVASLFVSCNGPEPESVVPQGEAEVCIGIPETRTVLDADGLSTRWEKGDRFALWAFAGGSETFAAVPFDFWGNKAEHTGAALFRGKVPAMPSDTYTYYAASPVPAATEGTRVSYDLPAVQDGTWHGDYDVLLAQASGRELRVPAAGAIDDVNPLDLRFRHKIHALKVTIPEGRNRFGRPVTRLRVQFPVAVAGRLTWDLAAPDAAPAVEQASDAVTLEFARPVGAGDSFWIYVAPCDLTGREVRFTATDGAEFSWPIETGAFRNLEAGQITSVTLTIPDLRPQSDYRLTIDPAQLGEAVTEIDALELPEGYSFPSLDLALRQAGPLAANADGTFSVRIFSDMGPGFPSEVGLTVGSANTTGVVGKLGTGQCTASGITAAGCTIKAPYLFFEDFSGVGEYSTDNVALLSDWGLYGWSGARAATVAATCVMANCHVSTHSGITDSRSRGRVDTAPMPIRAGKTLNLSVAFDMGYNTQTGTAGTGAGNSTATCTFGRTDAAPGSAIAADAALSHAVFSERSVSSLSDAANLPDKLTGQQVPGCGSTSRLSWQIYTTKRSWAATTTNITYRCHIDNIRATIVQ